MKPVSYEIYNTIRPGLTSPVLISRNLITQKMGLCQVVQYVPLKMKMFSKVQARTGTTSFVF